jgi:hypothetical protein
MILSTPIAGPKRAHSINNLDERHQSLSSAAHSDAHLTQGTISFENAGQLGSPWIATLDLGERKYVSMSGGAPRNVSKFL